MESYPLKQYFTVDCVPILTESSIHSLLFPSPLNLIAAQSWTITLYNIGDKFHDGAHDLNISIHVLDPVTQKVAPLTYDVALDYAIHSPLMESDGDCPFIELTKDARDHFNDLKISPFPDFKANRPIQWTLHGYNDISPQEAFSLGTCYFFIAVPVRASSEKLIVKLNWITQQETEPVIHTVVNGGFTEVITTTTTREVFEPLVELTSSFVSDYSVMTSTFGDDSTIEYYIGRSPTSYSPQTPHQTYPYNSGFLELFTLENQVDLNSKTNKNDINTVSLPVTKFTTPSTFTTQQTACTGVKCGSTQLTASFLLLQPLSQDTTAHSLPIEAANYESWYAYIFEMQGQSQATSTIHSQSLPEDSSNPYLDLEVLLHYEQALKSIPLDNANLGIDAFSCTFEQANGDGVPDIDQSPIPIIPNQHLSFRYGPYQAKYRSEYLATAHGTSKYDDVKARHSIMYTASAGPYHYRFGYDTNFATSVTITCTLPHFANLDVDVSVLVVKSIQDDHNISCPNHTLLLWVLALPQEGLQQSCSTKD